MSILKGILHHWNKTTESYDTIHPETEVAQITDWNNGIVNTLTSTALSSLVNVLSSDSLIALLIKKVFDATGVKYSLVQNGYVCFGSLVGGLIIQWGTTNKSQSYTAFPIAYTKFAVKCYSPTNTNEYSGVIITTSNNSHDISLTGINVDPSTYGRDYFTFGV